MKKEKKELQELAQEHIIVYKLNKYFRVIKTLKQCRIAKIKKLESSKEILTYRRLCRLFISWRSQIISHKKHVLNKRISNKITEMKYLIKGLLGWSFYTFFELEMKSKVKSLMQGSGEISSPRYNRVQMEKECREGINNKMELAKGDLSGLIKQRNILSDSIKLSKYNLKRTLHKKFPIREGGRKSVSRSPIISHLQSPNRTKQISTIMNTTHTSLVRGSETPGITANQRCRSVDPRIRSSPKLQKKPQIIPSQESTLPVSTYDDNIIDIADHKTRKIYQVHNALANFQNAFHQNIYTTGEGTAEVTFRGGLGGPASGRTVQRGQNPNPNPINFPREYGSRAPNMLYKNLEIKMLKERSPLFLSDSYLGKKSKLLAKKSSDLGESMDISGITDMGEGGGYSVSEPKGRVEEQILWHIQQLRKHIQVLKQLPLQYHRSIYQYENHGNEATMKLGGKESVQEILTKMNNSKLKSMFFTKWKICFLEKWLCSDFQLLTTYRRAHLFIYELAQNVNYNKEQEEQILNELRIKFKYKILLKWHSIYKTEKRELDLKARCFREKKYFNIWFGYIYCKAQKLIKVLNAEKQSACRLMSKGLWMLHKHAQNNIKSRLYYCRHLGKRSFGKWRFLVAKRGLVRKVIAGGVERNEAKFKNRFATQFKSIKKYVCIFIYIYIYII